MAHLRKEGTVAYPASGRVLILGVCGMEKKVQYRLILGAPDYSWPA